VDTLHKGDNDDDDDDNNNNNEANQYQAHFLTKNKCKRVLDNVLIVSNPYKWRFVCKQKHIVWIRPRSMEIVKSAMKHRWCGYRRKMLFRRCTVV
jgi:hypothetical protein